MPLLASHAALPDAFHSSNEVAVMFLAWYEPAGIVQADMVAPGAVVFDVGVSRIGELTCSRHNGPRPCCREDGRIGAQRPTCRGCAQFLIRSGIGRFFARPGVADNIFLGGNPPFQPTVSISDGLADNPGSGTNVGRSVGDRRWRF